MVDINAPTIIITSNIDPDDWYGWANHAHKEALKRRFTEVKHMKDPYVYANKIVQYIEIDD